jgi:hypothetical protein
LPYQLTNSQSNNTTISTANPTTPKYQQQQLQMFARFQFRFFTELKKSR